MATKHGQDAIRANEDRQLKFKTRLKVIGVIVASAIIWAVFEFSVFS